MANEEKDVLRLHGTETGLQPLMRARMDGFATDTYKLIHKFPSGVTKKWTPDEERIINASDVVYTNTDYPSLNDVELALNYLLRIPMDIMNFTSDTLVFERGDMVTGMNLTWLLTGSVTSLTLTSTVPDSIGLDVDDLSYGWTGAGITGSDTFTLAAAGSVDSDTESITVGKGYYTYWGQSASATPDEATIEAALAGGSGLELDAAASRSKVSFSQSGGGNYIYYAYPSSWGALSSITVNGFASTWNQTTVSVTGGFGYTQNYYVYTSPNVIVGSVTLVFA